MCARYARGLRKSPSYRHPSQCRRALPPVLLVLLRLRVAFLLALLLVVLVVHVVVILHRKVTTTLAAVQAFARLISFMASFFNL